MQPANQQPDDTLQTKFNNLVRRLQANPTEMKAFETDPVSVLREEGIPLVSSFVTGPHSQVAPAAEHVSVSRHWWGYDIKMSDKLTEDIIQGVTGAGAIGSLVTSAFAAAATIPPPVGPLLAGAVGTACTLKVTEIKSVNNGNGVSWPITWPQFATLVAAVPGGPPAVAAALMVFVHPVRN